MFVLLRALVHPTAGFAGPSGSSGEANGPGASVGTQPCAGLREYEATMDRGREIQRSRTEHLGYGSIKLAQEARKGALGGGIGGLAHCLCRIWRHPGSLGGGGRRRASKAYQTYGRYRVGR